MWRWYLCQYVLFTFVQCCVFLLPGFGINVRPNCCAFHFDCRCLCLKNGLENIWSENPVDSRLIWITEDCIFISCVNRAWKSSMWSVLPTRLPVIGRKVKWFPFRRIVIVEFSRAQVQVIAGISGVWWTVIRKEKVETQLGNWGVENQLKTRSVWMCCSVFVYKV